MVGGLVGSRWSVCRLVGGLVRTVVSGQCFACFLVGGRFLILEMVGGRCLNQCTAGGRWIMVGGRWFLTTPDVPYQFLRMNYIPSYFENKSQTNCTRNTVKYSTIQHCISVKLCQMLLCSLLFSKCM